MYFGVIFIKNVCLQQEDKGIYLKFIVNIFFKLEDNEMMLNMEEG